MKAIYKIKNIKTGDFYIGSSKDYSYRKWCHLRDLENNQHKNPILQNSWNKHGSSAFIFDIIEEIEDEKLLVDREQYYIDNLNPRYNICRTAGSPLGVKHTYEARMNMSNAHKGKTLKEMGHKEGCICSVCDKRSGERHPNYGKARNQETRKKLSKPVLQFDLNGKLIREWIGASEAGRELKCIPSHITSCCKGSYGRKTCANFIWKYKT